MEAKTTTDAGQSDKLTENGILTDGWPNTREEVEEYHGEPVHENDETVVFADSSGVEFDEFVSAFAEQGVSRRELSHAMHDAAKRFEPNDGIGHWGARWPLAFDTRTFEDEN